VPVVRELAQIAHRNFNQVRLARSTNDSVVEWTGEEFRENCDDVEMHWGEV
jgi:hypothetical protein